MKEKKTRKKDLGKYFEALGVSEYINPDLSEEDETKNLRYDATNKWHRRTKTSLSKYLDTHGFNVELDTTNTRIFMCHLIKVRIFAKYLNIYKLLPNIGSTDIKPMGKSNDKRNPAYFIAKCFLCGSTRCNRLGNPVLTITVSRNEVSFFLRFFIHDEHLLSGTEFALTPEQLTQIKELQEITEDSPADIFKKFMSIFFKKN